MAVLLSPTDNVFLCDRIQMLAGAGLGLPVGGLCSRHQALFGQSPLDVLPQLAPMPTLALSQGQPPTLISLGQSLQSHPLPPPPPPQTPGPNGQIDTMNSDQPNSQAAPDGAAHTLPRHQQPQQLVNGKRTFLSF